jgi:hypothetical protein
VLSIDASTMTPAEYEEAEQEALSDGDRSLYDLIMFDRHSTGRLYQGNYFFWGGVPELEGVEIGQRLGNEIIFNWDETHPILRHVGVSAIEVWDFYQLKVPSESELLMEGETTPVMAYFNRDGSNYLISAFPILTADEATGQVQQNTTWIWKPHFVIFLNNAIQYLTAALSPTGVSATRPGDPVGLKVADRAQTLKVIRPDGEVDEVPTGGAAVAHYARTRSVGVYESIGSPEGHDKFAVNLFDAEESNVRPQTDFYLGTREVATSSKVESIIRPVWQWVLLGVLAVLIFEWIVYNKRVLV